MDNSSGSIWDGPVVDDYWWLSGDNTSDQGMFDAIFNLSCVNGSAIQCAIGLSGANDHVIDILVAVVVCLMISNVFLNSMLLFTVLYLGRRHLRPAHVVVSNVSACDLCIGCVHLPFLLGSLLRGHSSDCGALCATLITLERSLIAASVWSITLVSMDRYLFIVKHSSYRRNMSFRTAGVGVAITWVLAAVIGWGSYLAASHTTHDSGHCFCHLTTGYYGFLALLLSAFYITICFIFPTTLIITFYSFVLKVASEHVSKTAKNPFRSSGSRLSAGVEGQVNLVGETPLTNSYIADELTGESTPASAGWYQARAAKVIAAIMVCYFLLLTPYFVVNIMISSGHWQIHTSPYFMYIASLLMFHANSCFNPLFYGLANRRLRDLLMEFIQRKLRGNGSHLEVSPSRCRASSPLSLMADFSSVSRRGSHNSDISALSATSREAIVCKDMLDLYTQRNRNGYSVPPVPDDSCSSPTFSYLTSNGRSTIGLATTSTSRQWQNNVN